MQGKGTLIRAIQLRALVIHAISHQPRIDIQRIAFVRPPAIHAEREHLAMRVPQAGRLAFVESIYAARVVDGPLQLGGPDHRMQDDAKMFLVKLIDDLFRIRKHPRIPGKGTVSGVPARRTETSPEKNHRVAGQLFLAEGPRLGQNLLAARQRPMRLLISQRPKWRHFRIPGEPRVFGHDRSRIGRANHKQVQRAVRRGWLKPAHTSREVEGAERLMDEHGPAARPDDPWNRNSAAMGAQHIAALAAFHAIG